MKFSILIIPAGGSKPAEVKFSLAVWFVLGVMLFCAFNLAVLGWNILTIGQKGELAYLRARNEELENALKSVSVRADSLAKSFEQLREHTLALMDLAQVEPPSGLYGVGGTQLSSPVVSMNSPRSLNFYIDSLLVFVREESKAFFRAESVYKAQLNVLRHTPSILPMSGVIFSGFGPRLDPITGQWRIHEGLDICAPIGTPVRATADGRVKFAGNYYGFGKMVIVDHIWFETRYAHLDKVLVQEGQKVSRGDIIGSCGRSGRTTGVHLHYEVRVAGKPVDPRNYILPSLVCVD